MPYLVVQDLGDGDAVHCVIDDVLWKQIEELPEHSSSSEFARTVMGLIDGKALCEFYTQECVIADVRLDGILGVLTLPLT
jgi:hypothetical protein